MKVLLLFFSTIIAIVSILYADTIASRLAALTTLINYTNTTTFKGLPFLPLSILNNTPSPNMTVPRAIRKAFLAIEQSEGVGARVRRSIGTPQLRNFSPFLMLDHFNIAPGAGFPDHPHRGQGTFHIYSPIQDRC